MDGIRILGGGISGLTAAINLKKAGLEVEVHERKNYCGKHTRDFQFLENWTSDEDVLEFLKRMNIEVNFYHKPIKKLQIFSPTFKEYEGYSENPLMYLVKRGPQEKSIDQSLEKQALRQGVRIIYSTKLRKNEADIIAIGIREPNIVALGVTFPLDMEDKAALILDNCLSPRYYSYFIVDERVGEITCVSPFQEAKNIKIFLGKTIKTFEDIFRIRVEQTEEFSAVGSFDFLRKAKINHQYYIGEAAGFHDSFLGFGMVYAFRSGFLAAQSISEKRDFDHLWKKDFLKQLEVAEKNRKLFNGFSNYRYERIIKLLLSRNPIVRRLLGGKDMQWIMKKVYRNSFSLFLRLLIFNSPLTLPLKFNRLPSKS